MAKIADKVYRNAKVYSVALDGTEIHAEAVAIKDGQFVYVGDEAGAAEWIGDATEVVDCHGKSVLPGLGDAHMHLAHASRKFGTCSFSSIVPDPGKDTPEEVLKQLQAILKTYTEKHMECFNHPLGRPPKEENDVHLEDKKRAIGERNEVEATFGTSKRVYRASNIRAKLDETADTWIGACFFAKNVMKFLRGLLRLIFEIFCQKPFWGHLYNNEVNLVPVFACHRLWHLKIN